MKNISYTETSIFCLWYWIQLLNPYQCFQMVKKAGELADDSKKNVLIEVLR